MPATFFVDNINNAGAGSLREAILDANAAAGSDLIRFDIATFSTAKTITLTTGELGITGPVSIIGPTKAALTINAAGTGRVFNINGAGLAAVSISNVTITGGVVTGAVRGGGIFSAESLTLANVSVTGNSSLADGGGIAIGTNGTLTATDCTISGNSAGTAVGSFGGGLFAIDSGNIVLEQCTVSNNFAAQSGGGIYFSSGASSLTLQNATISGNSANLGAGAVFLTSTTTSVLQINNSTIANNLVGSGGAIARGGAAPASIILISSVVDNSGPDFSTAGTVSADHSFIEDKSGIGNLINVGGTSIVGGSPGLLALASNGGTTKTHAVPFGSPVLNVGSNNLSLANDQRGTTRSEGITDMGAFEVHVPTAAAALANVTTAGATVLSFTVTYADEVAVKVSSLDSSDVRVTGPNGFNVLATFKSVNIGTDGTPRTATYEFTPPGGSWSDGDGGTYTVSVEANQVQDTHGFSVAAKAVDTFDVVLGTNLTVTNGNDAGAGSLRQAIVDANAFTPTNDTITFDATFFSTPSTISLLSDLPPIADGVSITGTTAANCTVNGKNARRIFNIDDGKVGSIVVNMSGLTLTGGNAGAGNGGAVKLADEKLTLTNCQLTGNTASNGGGLVFYSNNAGLIMVGCTISNNKATINGGGIYADSLGGIMTLDTCQFIGNKAGNLGGAAVLVNGTIFVDACLIAGNTSANVVGGLETAGSSVTLRNSTISGNTATVGVGGAAAYGSTQIQNCTIVNNSSGSYAGGLRAGSNATLVVESVIISGNTSPIGPDIHAPSGVSQVQAKNSAIGGTGGITNFVNNGGNLIGQSLNLGPLANNGGPTQTHALLPGSPCINAGSNPASLSFDQRGSGFARSVGVTDIGSFEAPVFPAKVTSVQINDGSAQRSRVTSLLVTFDSPPALPGTPSGAFQLKRQSDNATVTLSAVPSGNNVTLTFTGGVPFEFGSLADGRYTLTALASQITNLDGDGNGSVGDDYVLASAAAPNPPTNIFRLFGDDDGDGTTAANDFIQFRLSLGGSNPEFDFDGDGAVAASDFIQFRLRFGGSI